MPKPTSSQWPTWSTAPWLKFWQGEIKHVDLNQSLKNPQKQPMGFSLAVGSAPLPAGITLTGVNNQLVTYMGSGGVNGTYAGIKFKATNLETGYSVNSPVTEISIGGRTLTPSMPTDVTATAISGTEISIAWTAGAGGSVISEFRIYRSEESPAGPFVQIAVDSASPYVDASLWPGQTRYYAVAAYDGSILSPLSLVASAKTFAAPPEPPVSVMAVGTSETNIRVSWIAAVGGTPANAFRIYRSASINGSYSLLDEVAASILLYDDTVSAAQTFYYKLSAVDVSGTEGDLSAAAGGTSFAPQVPNPPSNVAAIGIDDDTIRITWAAPIGGPAPTAYRIMRSTTGAAGSWSQLTQVGADVFTYDHNSIAENSTRYYQLYAINAAGLSTASITVSATTFPLLPATPVNVSVAAISDTTLRIDWIAGSGGSPATAFRVLRATTIGGTYSQVAEVAASPYLDDSLSSNLTRYYKIVAVDADGDPSAASAIASGTTQTLLPSTPTNVAVVPISQTALNVSWNAGTGGSVITSYRVQRASASSGPWTQVGTPTSPSFVDDTLQASATRWYRVSAFDGTNESTFSVAAAGTTLAAPQPSSSAFRDYGGFEFSGEPGALARNDAWASTVYEYTPTYAPVIPTLPTYTGAANQSVVTTRAQLVTALNDVGIKHIFVQKGTDLHGLGDIAISVGGTTASPRWILYYDNDNVGKDLRTWKPWNVAVGHASRTQMCRLDFGPGADNYYVVGLNWGKVGGTGQKAGAHSGGKNIVWYRCSMENAQNGHAWTALAGNSITAYQCVSFKHDDAAAGANDVHCFYIDGASNCRVISCEGWEFLGDFAQMGPGGSNGTIVEDCDIYHTVFRDNDGSINVNGDYGIGEGGIDIKTVNNSHSTVTRVWGNRIWGMRETANQGQHGPGSGSPIRMSNNTTEKALVDVRWNVIDDSTDGGIGLQGGQTSAVRYGRHSVVRNIIHDVRPTGGNEALIVQDYGSEVYLNTIADCLTVDAIKFSKPQTPTMDVDVMGNLLLDVGPLSGGSGNLSAEATVGYNTYGGTFTAYNKIYGNDKAYANRAALNLGDFRYTRKKLTTPEVATIEDIVPTSSTPPGVLTSVPVSGSYQPGSRAGLGIDNAAGVSLASPVNLAAIAVSQTTINLSWEMPAGAATVSEYRIWRATVQAGPYTQIATNNAGETSYSDSTLQANTTRFYRVSAYDGAEESAQSVEASATTFPASNPTAWPTQGSAGTLWTLRNRRGFAMDTRHAFTGLSMGQSATIHRVTNFAEFKVAAETTGNRIIVFEKSGTYNGNGATVDVDNGKLWIAAQTAPDPGVTLRNCRLRIRGSDILVQHLRVHLTEDFVGPDVADALFIGGNGVTPTNLVFDHCNFGFSFDEIYDITATAACDVDFIECAFLYPLHCPGLRPDLGNKDHAHGPRQSAQTDLNVRVSWQGCMLAHNLGRGPRTSTRELLIANCLHYNWENRATNPYGELSMQQFANVIGNVYKTGPAGNTAPVYVEPTWGAAGTSKIHFADNWYNNNKSADQFASSMHQAAVASAKRSSTPVSSSIPTGWVGWPMSTAAEKQALENYVLGCVGARPINRNPSSVALVNGYANGSTKINIADAASKNGCSKGSSPGADAALAINAQAFMAVADSWNAHGTETDRRKIEVQLLDMSVALVGST